jgi:hypothetical protein
MPVLAELVDGVIGVDTHRDTLAAAALSSVGGVLAQTAVRADAAGYQALLSFADTHLVGRRCWGDRRCRQLWRGPGRLAMQPR